MNICCSFLFFFVDGPALPKRGHGQHKRLQVMTACFSVHFLGGRVRLVGFVPIVIVYPFLGVGTSTDVLSWAHWGKTRTSRIGRTTVSRFDYKLAEPRKTNWFRFIKRDGITARITRNWLSSSDSFKDTSEWAVWRIENQKVQFNFASRNSKINTWHSPPLTVDG
jgi:hypothetical protein